MPVLRCLLVILAATLAPARTAIHYWQRGSLGISPDAANYLFAADSIGAGVGVLGTDGQALTMFPPGFPAAIAAADAVIPGDAMAAALAVNLVSLLMLGIGVGVIAARAQAGRWAPVVVAALGLSAPIQLVATVAWSEPLALALGVWAFAAVQRIVDRPSAGAIIMTSVLVGAAMLVRTSAVFWLLGLVLACWVCRRLVAGVIIGVAGALPAAAWAIVNQVAHGDAAGVRGRPSSEPAGILVDAIRTTSRWWSLDRPRLWQWIGVAVIVAVGALVIRGQAANVRRAAVALLVVVAACTVGAPMVVAMDRLDDRLMAPVAVSVCVLVAATIGAWQRTVVDRVLTLIVGAGIALGSYHGVTVRPPQGAVPADVSCTFPAGSRSNLPEELAYRCGRPIAGSPRAHLYASADTTNELAELADVQATTCVRVVWIGPRAGGFRHSVADLESVGFTSAPGPGWLLLSSEGCR